MKKITLLQEGVAVLCVFENVHKSALLCQCLVFFSFIFCCGQLQIAVIVSLQVSRGKKILQCMHKLIMGDLLLCRFVIIVIMVVLAFLFVAMMYYCLLVWILWRSTVQGDMSGQDSLKFDFILAVSNMHFVIQVRFKQRGKKKYE